MLLLSLPYRWFKNIVSIQEKKAYSAYVVLLFCSFVAIARVMGEWFVGARDLWYIAGEVLGHVIFYWYSFFTFGFILFLLVPQPWRKSINVILIGVFLGVLPPIIDLALSGLHAVRYSYFWAFPTGWNFWIHHPEQSFPLGETIVLWLTILLTTAYVAHKTHSLWRSMVAAVLAYGVVVFNAGVLPATVRNFQEAMGWPVSHLLYLLLTGQVFVTILLYFAYQRRLTLGLLKRTHHSLPFVVMVLIGAAFVDKVNVFTLWHAFLVWFLFQTALLQNDLHDAADDAVQGRLPYADAEDVHFFVICSAFLIATLLLVNSAVGMLLLMILVLSYLYSYPFYRGKRYFPSNLKIEGGWGLSAFLVGMLGALEFGLYQMPRWRMPGDAAFRAAPDVPGWEVIIASLLVFGGHSILAILKDHKDVAADSQAGNQTVYTLAKRRGLSLITTHRSVAILTMLCLAAPLPLLYLIGRINLIWLPGGIIYLAIMSTITIDLSQKVRFDVFLWLLTGYLFYLLMALAL
jgi:4-hydroxybenzoate polyprenyltransferase